MFAGIAAGLSRPGGKVHNANALVAKMTSLNKKKLTSHNVTN
jgi:hypothetical protein